MLLPAIEPMRRDAQAGTGSADPPDTCNGVCTTRRFPFRALVIAGVPLCYHNFCKVHRHILRSCQYVVAVQLFSSSADVFQGIAHATSLFARSMISQTQFLSTRELNPNERERD